ncbi:MAG: SDR family oxidoreductase [Sporichthyaceae bacterium]
MSAPILVTGGTGTLGRHLVRELLSRGREVRVLSRKPRPGVAPGTPAAPGEPEWFVGDLSTGIGLPAALAGVTAIAHCAVGSRGDAQMGAQLMIAAARAGSPHLIFHSAVGAEAIRDGFYRDRRAMERLLEDGSLPWTVLRTTHFHEFVEDQLRSAARFPVMRVAADEQFQPIAAREVADRLADLCTGIQAHHVPVLGGPQILPATELAALYLKETRKIRKVVAMKLPGGDHEGWRAGAHLAPTRMIGEQTFAEYLVSSRELELAEEASLRAAKAAAKESAKQAERDAREAEKAARAEAKAAEKAARAAEKEQRGAERSGGNDTAPNPS